MLHKHRETDLKILIGDFNAKTGGNNSKFERVMDKHGLGRMLQSHSLSTASPTKSVCLNWQTMAIALTKARWPFEE